MTDLPPNARANTPPAPLLDDGMKRPVWPAIWKGMKKRCPNCGTGRVLAGYTKVASRCDHCGQDFTGHQADDAPPYVTMMIVGHSLAIPIVEVKRHLDPPLGLMVLIWMAIAIVMTLVLLPVTKGGIIGLQWAQRMHGFGPDEDPEAPLRP